LTPEVERLFIIVSRENDGGFLAFGETMKITARTIRWVAGITILVSLTLVVLAGFSVVRRTVTRVYERVVSEVVPEIPEVVASQRSEEIYSLLDGWNLVAFPFVPDNFSTAAGLMLDVAENGGYITTVSVWDGDRWQEFSQRGGISFGQDFSLEPGKAYFVRSHEQMEWRVAGDLVERGLEVSLEPGWNGVGFVSSGFTASSVIDGINQGLAEKAREIDWWNSGAWEVFVKRIYSESDIQEYGINFPVELNRGYMIRATEEVSLRL
jgi:hypothetical protein